MIEGEVVVRLLERFGLPTVLVFLMFYLFIRFSKNHRDERKEWREDFKKMDDRGYEEGKETREVLKTLTTVIDTINRKR